MMLDFPYTFHALAQLNSELMIPQEFISWSVWKSNRVFCTKTLCSSGTWLGSMWRNYHILRSMKDLIISCSSPKWEARALHPLGTLETCIWYYSFHCLFHTDPFTDVFKYFCVWGRLLPVDFPLKRCIDLCGRILVWQNLLEVLGGV